MFQDTPIGAPADQWFPFGSPFKVTQTENLGNRMKSNESVLESWTMEATRHDAPWRLHLGKVRRAGRQQHDPGVDPGALAPGVQLPGLAPAEEGAPVQVVP